MKERGHLLEHYQRLEQTLSGQVEALRAQLDQFRAAARPPVVGFVKVTAAAEGHWPDGWTAPEVALTLELLRPSSRLVLRGWRPPGIDTRRRAPLARPAAGRHGRGRRGELRARCGHPG